ncbi:unnamed protein product, partial [marine sediment metagenome]
PGFWDFSQSYHPDARKSIGITVTVRAGKTTRGVDLYLEQKQEKPSGSVRGTVFDAAGRRISGATILATRIARPWRTLTNERGEYSIERLEPGRYRFTALDPTSMTYGRARADITVEEESVVDITVRDKAARIRGTVLDDQRQPVNVLPWIIIQGVGFMLEVDLDETGAYDCGPVPPGSYRVFALPLKGYKVEPPSGYEVTLGEGEQLDNADFVLTPMSSFLAGTVVYSDGSPAAERFVVVGGQGV